MNHYLTLKPFNTGYENLTRGLCSKAEKGDILKMPIVAAEPMDQNGYIRKLTSSAADKKLLAAAEGNVATRAKEWESSKPKNQKPKK